MILARNEDFFLKMELSDLAEEQVNSITKLTSTNTTNIMNHILRIKDFWRSERLTASDKKAIWDYFRVFFYLAEKDLEARNSGKK